MNLNVGCGNNPRFGDWVNIDLFVSKTLHRHYKALDTKLTQNFIKCDAQHLPFKDKCFNLVYSSHVLEHVKNPVLMLQECARVAQEQLNLKVPHWLTGRKPEHKSYFSKKWIVKALYGLGVYHVAVTYRYSLHKRFVPFPIPFEMNIQVIL